MPEDGCHDWLMTPPTTACYQQDIGFLPCCGGALTVSTRVSPHSAPLSGEPSGPLSGRLRPPGDKSISHRAFILGLLTSGGPRSLGLLEGEDVLHTGAACRALGAQDRTPRRGRLAGRWHGHRLAAGAARRTLDFGNAGTGARLMMGVVGGHGITARFRRRCLVAQAADAPRARSAYVHGRGGSGAGRGRPLPDPAQGHAGAAADRIPDQSRLGADQIGGIARRAQFARPHRADRAAGEPRPYRKNAGAISARRSRASRSAPHGRKITLEGRPELHPSRILVPADPSSAAFPMVAALIVPGSDIVIEGMMMNPLRIGLLQTLARNGRALRRARPARGGRRNASPILRVRGSALRGVDVPAERAPSMIDEYPILAVAAAFAAGETRMRGLSELRVKESDRLAAIAAGLAGGRRRLRQSRATISSSWAAAARCRAAASPRRISIIASP